MGYTWVEHTVAGRRSSALVPDRLRKDASCFCARYQEGAVPPMDS